MFSFYIVYDVWVIYHDLSILHLNGNMLVSALSAFLREIIFSAVSSAYMRSLMLHYLMLMLLFAILDSLICDKTNGDIMHFWWLPFLWDIVGGFFILLYDRLLVFVKCKGFFVNDIGVYRLSKKVRYLTIRPEKVRNLNSQLVSWVSTVLFKFFCKFNIIVHKICDMSQFIHNQYMKFILGFHDFIMVSNLSLYDTSDEKKAYWRKLLGITSGLSLLTSWNFVIGTAVMFHFAR